jgi:hypothetical protein
MLTDRERFNKDVFSRDNGLCVICKSATNIVVHHIIDRSLWGDNYGYSILNGVSLCPTHHMDAEMTILSCSKLREAAGISQILLPEHFYMNERYDHWGNILLPSGMRIKGELFGEENVQKILKQAGVLDQFLEYVKYPRTYHISYSENLQNDDKQHPDDSFFDGKEVIVSEKVDGECSSLYPDYIHARSLDSKYHESRAWLRALHGKIAHEIPRGYRVCGENLYAEHSIRYSHLKSYFYVYSVWDENNCMLSWDETVEWCQLLGLEQVPVIYRGPWSKNIVHRTFLEYCSTSKDAVEGYVIRLPGRIFYKDFKMSCAKWVRAGHVQTEQNWMTKKIIPNELATKNGNT